MRIFVAGATGAVGSRLVPHLVQQGHEVTALCRNETSAQRVRAFGAAPAIGDAFDFDRLDAAIAQARPEVVIHQLTSLSRSPVNLKHFDRGFAVTNLLRTRVLDRMLDAARTAGARHFIAQSFCGWPQARTGARVKTEADPLDAHPYPAFRASLAAIKHLEEVVPAAQDIEGVVLRYGVLYGPGTQFWLDGEFARLVGKRMLPVVSPGTGVWSFTHVADAAGATVAALDRGAPGIYNIVDDEPAALNAWLPYFAQVLHAPPPFSVPAWLARWSLGAGGVAWLAEGRGSSNAKAAQALDWRPNYASWRDGFKEVARASERAASLENA
jgi:nucleoside-diphosphate-sugar epimerase